jgi:ABC-type nickel/cobalt efflux system permease component RcnA
MRLRLLVAAVVAAALLVLPGAASAHPLGNFSINHLARVAVSADRVDVTYVLDEAEIPTFQERGDGDATVLARKRAEVAKRLVVTVDGRRVALRPAGRAVLSHPPGAGGLKTTRVELALTAPVHDPRDVRVNDGTFPGRVGWKAIVVQPGRDTAVRSSAPATDPTNGLRRYPADLLKSPSNLRSAHLVARPGAGTVQAPDGTRLAHTQDRTADRGFTKVFSDAAAGKGVLVLLLLTAFGWGAVHALSPGHGKAMVAAYLVGTRGTPRHALGLGGIVTLTHTIGVFALGGITLALSAYILPEDLYPWLNLVSGLLVVGIGATVLRANLRRLQKRHAHHHQSHDHDHHHHHGHDHDHDHHHVPTEPGWRGIMAMGASAGLIPCPSALVVLLGAVSQGQVALGMLLIVVFSAGLAMTLSALGLVVVLAGRLTKRAAIPHRLVTTLPAVSAIVIVGVGCVLTARALPMIGVG